MTQKRTFLFTFIDFGEQVAEIDIKETDTEEKILGYLKYAFPALKGDTYYVKGFYEGSSTGVYKPFNRVRWMTTPEMTHFYLDVATGDEAKNLQAQKLERQKTQQEEKASVIQTLRKRWGEGYRKCCKCQGMYLVQRNNDTACKFVEQGFSPEEGSYKRMTVGKHVQAKAKLESYNEHVKDITTVGGISKGIGLGTVGIGLVAHAKEGGSLGSNGENLNGWEPSDFLSIEPDKDLTEEGPQEETSSCLIM